MRHMRLTGHRSSPITAGVLGLFAIAMSIDCGSSASVPSSTGGPTYGQLGDQSPVAWSTAFGGRGVTPAAVAAASDGTTRIAATLSGGVTIGETELLSKGGADVLLVELGPDGEPLWARSYGDPEDQSASDAVVDGEGNMIVVGTFAGTLDLEASAPVLEVVPHDPQQPAPGTSPMRAAGAADAFVAKLDHVGNLLWSTHLGHAGTTTQGRAVALGANGAIALTGGFQDALASSPGVTGDTDVFVALFDDAGRLQWMKSFGDAGTDVGTSIAGNAQGELAVLGTYDGAIDLGAGPLPTFGGRDVFVAKLDAQGTITWGGGFGGPADDDAVGVAFDPSGNVLALGTVAGAASFGAPLRDRVVSARETGRVLLAKYDGTGQTVWVERYGSGDPLEKATALAVDGQGQAYVAGQLRTPFDVGACSLAPTSSVGVGQAFVFMTTPGGQATCGQRYGLGAEAAIVSIAMAPARGIVMTGDFDGSIDLGQGALSAQRAADFVAREEPIPQPMF